MVKWSKTAKILNYNFHVWKKEKKKLVSCLWAIFMQKVFSSFTSSPPWSFQKLILVLLGVLQINFRLWKVLHLLDLYFFPRVAAAGEKEHKKLIHLNSPETMHFINEFCYTVGILTKNRVFRVFTPTEVELFSNESFNQK